MAIRLNKRQKGECSWKGCHEPARTPTRSCGYCPLHLSIDRHARRLAKKMVKKMLIKIKQEALSIDFTYANGKSCLQARPMVPANKTGDAFLRI